MSFQKGTTYSYLTVLNPEPDKSRNGKIKCRCICENVHYVTKPNLIQGRTKSCGCKRNALISKANCKYPWMTKQLYDCFKNMKYRCYNKDHKQYKDYGARGIIVCDEWLEGGASVFGKWAVNNGWKKGLHLDRRKNSKGYSPDNCRWVTQKVNNQNRRNTLKVEYESKVYLQSEFLKLHGSKVDYRTFKQRIDDGVDPLIAATKKDLRRRSTFYYSKHLVKNRRIQRLKENKLKVKFPICLPPLKAKIIVKSGSMFGYWKVLHETDPTVYSLPNGNSRIKRRIACKCTACNNIVAAPFLDTLQIGSSKHCGCLQPEQARKANTIHGFRSHPLRGVYNNMLDRCYNPGNNSYPDYGGRGIKVCKEWCHNSLEVFAKWALANGYQKGLHLDRRNNSKGYSPDNCRFITPTENANNKRSRRKLNTYDV